MESYERHKKEGAVTIIGLRHAAHLRARRQADGRPDPRHLAGLRQRRRRRRPALPVHLPHRRHLLVAGGGRASTSPRSSSAAASRARRSPTSSTTTRPAGSRSRCSRTSRALEGFQLKTFAVPPPGVEMGAQVLDIAQRFRRRLRRSPTCSAARPSVSIKELKRDRLPAAQGGGVRVGLGRGQHRGGRRASQSPRVTTTMQFAGRGQRLPGAERDPRDVQEAGQGGAEGDGLHGLLQPRGAGRRAPRRGHPQRAQGQAGRQDHRRRRRRPASRRSPTSRWAGWCRRSRSRPPTTRAAGSSRSGRSRTASSRRSTEWFAAYPDVVAKHIKERREEAARENGEAEGARPTPRAIAMLTLNNIEVIYDGVILVLKGVSLDVARRADHHPARRQRRRQDDHAEGHLGRAPHRAGRGHQGHDRARAASGSTACRPTRSSSAGWCRCSRAGGCSST